MMCYERVGGLVWLVLHSVVWWLDLAACDSERGWVDFTNSRAARVQSRRGEILT